MRACSVSVGVSANVRAQPGKLHRNAAPARSASALRSFCQPNRPKLVGLVDPVKGLERVVDDNFFQTKLTTLFISDIKADRFRMVEDQKKQKEQEESLLDASQQEALDQILNLIVKLLTASIQKKQCL